MTTATMTMMATKAEVVRAPISSETATLAVKEAAEASTIVSPSTTTPISTSVKAEVDSDADLVSRVAASQRAWALLGATRAL